MDQLLELTTPVTDEWEILGVKLGLEVPILNDIRVTHQASGVGVCKTHMFEKWLNKFPEASWDTVINALKEMKYNAAAKVIEDGRHQNSGMNWIAYSGKFRGRKDLRISAIGLSLSTKKQDICG